VSARLRIAGNVTAPQELDFDALRELGDQLLEPSTMLGGQPIAAVPLDALLELAGVAPSTRSIVAESSDGSFSTTLQLASASTCVVIYRIGHVPFPRELGGPFRLVTRGVHCGDVKSLGAIYASEEPAFEIGDSEVICLRARGTAS
jgi:DMSO/TMAO reductase YedYZ molybdopterin-dependent catalytic subunit